MYQWRKFEFFEEKSAGRGGGGGSAAAVPAEIAGRVTCCSGGRGRVAVGCDDGTVGLLDRGFRLSYGFQAYASSVLFLQQLKVPPRTLVAHLKQRRSRPPRKFMQLLVKLLARTLLSGSSHWIMCNSLIRVHFRNKNYLFLTKISC
jgi:hypothetical protein